MATQVWEWTFVCVTEGETREEALQAAYVYLVEQIAHASFDPDREELLEERND